MALDEMKASPQKCAESQPIPEAMTQLATVLDSLHNRISELTERLATVLRDPNPSKDGVVAETEDSNRHCELEVCIRGRIECVDRALLRIDDILLRLEL